MRRLLIAFLLIGVVAVAAVVALRMVFPLPDVAGRTSTEAIPANAETVFGQMMLTGTKQHPGKSGVLPLFDGVNALQSRLILIDNAEASIDAQYYIWHDDISGNLLFDALKRATERGVRVRLLLDDNGVPGLDTTMSALNELLNFEIRLFNPSTIRNPKQAGFAFDFPRMNRRMHNKSLIVDGAAAIIGGRNIGDEYFQIGEGTFFFDLDVLAVGSIVPETAAAFDDYWNSGSVFAVETVISPDNADLPAFERAVVKAIGSPAGQMFTAAGNSAAASLEDGTASLEWTDVALVVDDPVKGEGKATREQLMITRLSSILGKVQRRVDLVSAYFIPGKIGTEWFTDIASNDKQVRILTNALVTTDVLMVHSGYVKYRRSNSTRWEIERY